MELLSYGGLDEDGEKAIRESLADLDIVDLTPEVKERADDADLALVFSHPQESLSNSARHCLRCL